MSYKVIATPRFLREAKYFAKKFPSAKSEIEDLIVSLEHHPEQGTSLGQHCYKIRLAIASKGKGKSGGARVIICVRVVLHVVYLLSIYDKSEKENIYDRELQDILKFIP